MFTWLRYNEDNMAKLQLTGRLNAEWEDKVKPKILFFPVFVMRNTAVVPWKNTETTKFLRASPNSSCLPQPDGSSTSFTHPPISNRVPPYELGHTQVFFRYINPKRELGFSHRRCWGKKEETDLWVIEGLCIIMGICGTFLSNCWAAFIIWWIIPFFRT